MFIKTLNETVINGDMIIYYKFRKKKNIVEATLIDGKIYPIGTKEFLIYLSKKI